MILNKSNVEFIGSEFLCKIQCAHCGKTLEESKHRFITLPHCSKECLNITREGFNKLLKHMCNKLNIGD